MLILGGLGWFSFAVGRLSREAPEKSRFIIISQKRKLFRQYKKKYFYFGQIRIFRKIIYALPLVYLQKSPEWQIGVIGLQNLAYLILSSSAAFSSAAFSAMNFLISALYPDMLWYRKIFATFGFRVSNSSFSFLCSAEISVLYQSCTYSFPAESRYFS